MLENVICDYIDGFRWSRIKQAYQKGGWWTYLYFLTVLPAFADFYESVKYTVTYFLIMFPALFCMFASPLHPLVMPKVMYLCPMDRRQRRLYVKWSGYLHIAVPFVLGAMGILILVLAKISDFLCACGLLLNIFLLPIWCCGINPKGFGGNLPDGGRCLSTSSGWGICETVGILTTVISEYSYCAILCREEPVSAWIKYIVLGFGILVQLPLAIRYLKGWKGAVERAVDYETAYR